MSYTLMLLASAVGPSPWQVRDNNWDSWNQCLEVSAQQFSRGSDSADIVADTVVDTCEPFLMGFIYYSDDSKAEFPGMTRAEVVETLEALRIHRQEEFEFERRRGHANAQRLVVEARARNAPNP